MNIFGYVSRKKLLSWLASIGGSLKVSWHGMIQSYHVYDDSDNNRGWAYTPEAALRQAYKNSHQ